MFKLEHGRDRLYQYDINQRLIVEGIEPGSQVHFNNVPVTPYSEDGVVYADVPNELLTEYGWITAYAYISESGENYTKETFRISIEKREKPDDYDANIMFSDTVDEILGEVVDGGLSDKLAYMKECLDILYQSPPIKLMREVYGENKSLKELFEYISIQESEGYKSATGKYLKYEIGNKFTGYLTDYLSGDEEYVYPNGEPLIGGGSASVFICPKVCLYPNQTISTNKYIGTFAADTVKGVPYINYTNFYLIDFRNLDFGSDNIADLVDMRTSYAFMSVANVFYGVYLPKCSVLNYRTLLCGNFDEGNCYVKNGIHLGKYVVSCTNEWIFTYVSISDVSAQPETPVYCDKDFYVNGILYLEKLNIPLDCIIGIMENAIYVPEGLPTPTLSIGDFNVEKIYFLMSELPEEDMMKIDEFAEKVSYGEITPEQAIAEIKNIDNRLGIYFEFTEVKGWVLQ